MCLPYEELFNTEYNLFDSTRISKNTKPTLFFPKSLRSIFSFAFALAASRIPVVRDEGYNCGYGELETIQHIIQKCPKRAEERKKLKKVSPNLELPILLNTKKALQAMAEFIMTGQKHDTAKLEVRQINQSSSRQLEAIQATSQQADSSECESD
ncbi:hypothetical protein TRICI_004376 [Trichomonascus ciferrii]|uniref:Uncharacterized protein n=1 Tax=Trichomonascus ciferrii TaxID=44093 RepID=A0A642V117_9ASCO|nr:hypothetical protein TRICI_004376 [Trichomonascus ciferrii]